MKKIILAFLFLAIVGLVFAGQAPASLIAKAGQDWVRITNAVCDMPNLVARAKPQYRDAMRGGSASIDGAHFRLCWLMADDTVHVIYEDGEYTSIPTSAFRAETSL